MLDFRVWIEREKRFIDSNIFNLEGSYLIRQGVEIDKDRGDKIFLDIGLEDINGKSVYPESSIVEFDTGSGGEYHIFKGYLTYCCEDLEYKFICLIETEFNIKKFRPCKYKNLKIIDTMQENKLRLISPS